MRVLKFTSHSELSYAEFIENDVPPYAILSHMAGPEDEGETYQDLEDDAGKSRIGSSDYNKIIFYGKQAIHYKIVF